MSEMLEVIGLVTIIWLGIILIIGLCFWVKDFDTEDSRKLIIANKDKYKLVIANEIRKYINMMGEKNE